MRDGLSALGRDPSTLDIVGVLPILEDQHGAVDFKRTMEEVPELTAAGVTDFRLNTAIPDGFAAATDFLAALVEAFQAAR